MARHTYALSTPNRPGFSNVSRRILLDISSQMKRMIRAIESIPLHLNLDIIRLDDALGESWALPFQACTKWRVSCHKQVLVDKY
jgi:hypothetical protein